MYTDKFATKKGELKWSVEIMPPGLGKSIPDIKETLDDLVEYKPIGIDVTYHQEKMQYKKVDGVQIGFPLRKNPGTVPLCAYLVGRYVEKYGVEIIPHIICGGFSMKESEEALIDLFTVDISTILALRGDPQHLEDGFISHPEGHKYASGLVEQIANMNKGKYIYPIENAVSTKFCIGVAGYPDKHYESPNLDYDILRLKEKVDKGAHYIITQMFFDNKSYISFVEKAKSYGINVPILPGIKPLSSKKQISLLSSKFYIDIPQELVSEIMKHDDKCSKEIGTEWCINQCKELVEYGVPALHFFSMNRGSQIKEILKKVG